jgi:hypothetical protein
MIRTTPLVVAVMLIIAGFSFCSNRKKEAFTAIELIWSMPMVDSHTNQLFVSTDSNSIYFKDGITLYKKKNINITGNKQSNVFSYWVFNDTAKSRLCYNPLISTKGKKFNVDSFQRENMFKDVSSTDLLGGEYVLAGSSPATQQTTFQEHYILNTKKDKTWPDTMILYYDQGLLDIPFSFSKKLDKAKGAKLTAVKSIFNPIPDSRFKFEINRREMLFQVKRKQVSHPDSILYFFHKFVKDKVSD